MTLEEIEAVYHGRDADRTKALYARLQMFAPRGLVAVELLRVARNSEMAKGYKTRAGRAAAYDTKDWSIGELCRALRDNPDVIASWGWARDDRTTNFENVIYVDIPGAGQVSFHTSYRRDGPDYSGTWDGARGTAPVRICRWVEAILDGREVVPLTKGERNGGIEDRPEGGAAQSPATGPGWEEHQETFGF